VLLNAFSQDGLAFISDEQAAELRNVEVLQHDVLLNITGDSVARACEVDSRVLPARVNQHVAIVRPNSGEVDPRFLLYWLVSPDTQAHLLTMAGGGATRNALTKSMIEGLQLPQPPLPIQEAIASVLGALDDKIELNRRLNETLEAMARALFRSWFVDFDPVRAKAEGRPTGLPADLDALFPSEFEDSPLGTIPKGWRAGTIEDVADCRRRSASMSSIIPDEPYVGLEHIDKKSLALHSWGTGADVASQKSRFQPGEILFGKLRPYFHKVCIAPVAGICSTDILVVDSREPGYRSFAILALSEESTIDFVTACSGGTRMPRTSWSDLCRVPLVIPQLEVAAAFNELMAECLEQVQNSAFENHSLAAQRDFLLPKLLSGEIEVADLEVCHG
jgi:type I restriction enzyme, S subunit